MLNQDNNQNNKNTAKKTIRTYSSDMASAVQEKGGEAFRIARVEEGIRDKETKILARQNKMNLIWGLGGLALILAGTLSFFYFSYQPKIISNPEPPIPSRSIIFFDNQTKIAVDGLDYDKILTAYRKVITEEKTASGTIKSLEFTENKQKISLSRLFNLLRITPPKEAGPYWDNNYFIGFLSDADQNWPFIILRTSSYRDISPSIIAWEDHMLDDLSGWLNVNVTGNNNYLLQSKFGGLIVSNKETKAITNKMGGIELMYVYLDEYNILFARNKNTLDEVLLRLFSPKK